MTGLSDTQRRLKEKWLVQKNRSALRAIEVDGLRGLREARVEFRYPIVAIAGVNGSGKTTLLTAAACSYHGQPPFVPPSCKADRPYYTFNDFFVGSKRDGHFEGSAIEWHYFPDTPKDSLRIEKRGAGKWMHYDRRPSRPTAYVGLERVLPAAERRVLRRHFGGAKTVSNKGLSPDARKAVNAITNLSYSGVELAESQGHRIFEMTRGNTTYSSFHSGAGEEVVCELASLLDGVPEDSLVLIEEVEAGLHPALQVGLMRHLMETALERRIQVIVTTHSSHIMSTLPSDGRVFLKRLPNGDTSVEYGVSPVYVLSELSDQDHAELTIYVEDDVSVDLIRALLPPRVRRRVRIQPLGSFTLIATQAAAYYADRSLGRPVFVVDGDIRQNRWSDYVSAFKKAVAGEVSAAVAWLEEATTWLPGQEPERLLWEVARSIPGQEFLVARNYLAEDLLKYAETPEPPDWHSVPYDLARLVSDTREKVRRDLCDAAVTTRSAEFDPILDRVVQALETGTREPGA